MRSNIRSNAFTLVEVLVVVVILVVIATISTLAYTKFQSDARDNTRRSKASLLADSLEKYYMKNGEYPSTNTLTSSNVSQVKSLLSINDSDIFVMPGATSSTQNSIVANVGPSTSTIVYDAESVDPDENNSCKNASAFSPAGCDSFTLRWTDESGDEQSISSRQQDRPVVKVSPPQRPSAPVITASKTTTTVSGTVTPVTCELNTTAQYIIIYWINSNSKPAYGTNWTTDTSLTVSLNPGTTYRFQAIARCTKDATSSEASDESNIATINTPSNIPTLSSQVNPAGTSVTLTGQKSDADTCATTIYYSIQVRVNSGSWSADNWVTANTLTQAMTTPPANRYDFALKTRCGTSGTISPTSNIETVVSAPAAPNMVSPSATTSGNAASMTWTWSTVACPSGFTPEYAYVTTSNRGNSYSTLSSWSTATSATISTSLEGNMYAVVSTARCTNGSIVSYQSTNSQQYLYVRNVNAQVWAYTGSIRTYRPGSSTTYVVGNAQASSSRAAPSGTTVSGCDNGGATTGLVRQIKWAWDTDVGSRVYVNRPDTGEPFGSWQNWTYGYSEFLPLYGGPNGNGDLDTDETFEAVAATRCVRLWNNVELGSGVTNTSDNYGNLRMLDNNGKAHTWCDQNTPAPYCEGNGTGYNIDATATGACSSSNGSYKYCFSKIFNPNTAVWGWR